VGAKNRGEKNMRYNTYFTVDGVRKNKVYESESTDHEKIRKKLLKEFKNATDIKIRQSINATEGKL
jgi:hypothetical protein